MPVVTNIRVFGQPARLQYQLDDGPDWLELAQTHDAADMVTGLLASARVPWAIPGTIGTITRNSGLFTSLNALVSAGVAIRGQSTGVGTTSFGVEGQSTDGYGVYGQSTNSHGVYGQATAGAGVYGYSTAAGAAVQAVNAGTGLGLYATSIGNSVVFGLSTNSVGVQGQSINGNSVRAYRNSALTGTTTPTLLIHQEHVSDTNPAARIQQDGPGDLLVLGREAANLVRFDGAGRLTVQPAIAGTTAVENVIDATATSTGTPAAGFGVGVRLRAASASGAMRDMARLRSSWSTAADATRTADVVLSASDATAERTVLHGRATGTAPAVGFLGATPQTRPVLTGDRAGNVVLAALLTALAGFGLLDDATTAGVAVAPEFRLSGGFIQWRANGTVAWANLIATADLMGAPGATGPTGPEGPRGLQGLQGIAGQPEQLEQLARPAPSAHRGHKARPAAAPPPAILRVKTARQRRVM